MIVISHRGLWKNTEEKNKKQAFINSFRLGYGTETDLRDIKGKIIISHDMPKGDELSFEELLQLMDGRNLPLALNIKADGQIEAILELLAKYNHTNYFTFDMSIPDLVVQCEAGANAFSGMSDVQPLPIMLQNVCGIWLDSFNSDWYQAELVDSILTSGKKVCIVSSDLHKRDTEDQWNKIKSVKQIDSSNLILCTDQPIEATKFFYGKD